MSDTRGYGQNGLKMYSNITMPARADFQFTVASTNANGLGIASLKSNGYVRNVFMHTTQTPGVNNTVTNPNPASGYIYVQMKQNHFAYLGNQYSVISPVTGSALTSLTKGNVYVIFSLGTTTTAQWVTAGLTPGLVPTIGQSFVAASTASLSGTGTVKVVAPSGVSEIECVGNPQTMIQNQSMAVNGGSLVLLQILGATSSSVTTTIPTAPVDGTIISMSLFFDLSSVTIDGL